ncbi:hypothetical protein VNO77_29997 [Canavalia gladiata]|uniref:Uncharacterized protein n=1 Tax=Canavalia gladiata TaxID=3824 RepID=A0AAN9KPX3_CANGL
MVFDIAFTHHLFSILTRDEASDMGFLFLYRMFYALLAVCSHQVENVLEFLEKWTAHLMKTCVFHANTILAIGSNPCKKNIIVNN